MIRVVRSIVFSPFLFFLFPILLPVCAIVIVDYGGVVIGSYRSDMYLLKCVSRTGVAFNFDVHTLLVDGYTICRSVAITGDLFAAGMPQFLRRCKSNENSNNILSFFLFLLAIA